MPRPWLAPSEAGVMRKSKLATTVLKTSVAVLSKTMALKSLAVAWVNRKNALVGAVLVLTAARTVPR